MHPALGPQLTHPGVDQRIAGPALLPGLQSAGGRRALVRLVHGHLLELRAGPARVVASGLCTEHVGEEVPPGDLAGQRAQRPRTAARPGPAAPSGDAGAPTAARWTGARWRRRRARRAASGRRRPPRSPGPATRRHCSPRLLARRPGRPARRRPSGRSTRSSAASQSAPEARTAGAGSCTPWSIQARWNGVNTWNGVPELLIRVPGRDRVRGSGPAPARVRRRRGPPRPARPGAARTGRSRPPTCTCAAPTASATRGTTFSGLPRTTLSPGPPPLRRSASRACSAACSQARRAVPAAAQQGRVEHEQRQHRGALVEGRARAPGCPPAGSLDAPTRWRCR